jgi:hypothetical protein
MSWKTIEDQWAAMTRRVGVGGAAVASVQKLPASVSHPTVTPVVQTEANADSLPIRS